MHFRQLFTCLSLLCALSATSLCLAKNINLYDQPEVNAKIIGSIDPALGIIPIFSSNKDWLKVGDPHNGNVGWVKSSDLTNSTDGVAITQQIINTGKGPHTYIMQYGSALESTAAQIQSYALQLKAQQEAIQKNMQQMFQDLYKNSQQQWNSFPLIVPIIVVPEPNAQTPSTTQENGKK